MVRALDDGAAIDSAEHQLKMPPNSIEAEQSLLGGLMLDNAAWDKVADLIVASDFYRKDHRLIFAAIAELAETSNPCDVVTLSELLDNRDELEASGGLEYLAMLTNDTPLKSRFLMNLHFWAHLIGGVGMAVCMGFAGMDGMLRRTMYGADHPFKPEMIGAAVFGSLMVVAYLAMMYNIVSSLGFRGLIGIFIDLSPVVEGAEAPASA